MFLIDITEEHLEEADFLCQQRTNGLCNRSYTLVHLAELEERLLAHLDGLILGSHDARNFLEPKLSEGERGEAFAAAAVALESEDDGPASLVCDRLRTAPPSVRAGILDAFCHTAHPRVEAMLGKLMESDSPAEKSAAIDCLSFRRAALDPNDLRSVLHHQDVNVVRSALVVIARLRMTELERFVRPLLAAENIDLWQEAIRTGLVVSSEPALDEARRSVQKTPGQAGEMLLLIGNAGRSRDLPLLTEALKEPALAQHAVTALGLLGCVEAIPPLIDSLVNRDLAGLVGEAIQLITGIDLEKEGLAIGNVSEPRNDNDDNFEEDPDEDLPWPDSAKVEQWWMENRGCFNARIRYRGGLPHSPVVLLRILKDGSLPLRHHVAFELALAGPSFPYIETHAFAREQWSRMAVLEKDIESTTN